MEDRRALDNEEGIRGFDRELRALLGPESVPEYTVEPRVSGVEVILFYEKGTLCRAMTRSDPSGGSDVTPNIRTILTVPLEILSVPGVKAPPDRMEVWGIAYLESVEKPGKGPGAKAAVAASLVGADLRETARRPYNLFCCGVERAPEVGACLGVETHYEIMLALQDMGFRVNRPHIRHCAGLSAVIENICAVKEQRGALPYEVDGAILQVNSLTQRRALEGRTSSPIFSLELGSSATG
jgi:DNA ligase (NAD+)